MKYQVTGKITYVGPEQEVGRSTKYPKREVWVETPGEYPQTAVVEFFGKNAPKADGLTMGQEVTIHFDLKGNPWTGADGEKRCYTKLNAWKVEKAADATGDIPF